jgi:hypothetical protein
VAKCNKSFRNNFKWGLRIKNRASKTNVFEITLKWGSIVINGFLHVKFILSYKAMGKCGQVYTIMSVPYISFGIFTTTEIYHYQHFYLFKVKWKEPKVTLNLHFKWSCKFSPIYIVYLSRGLSWSWSYGRLIGRWTSPGTLVSNFPPRNEKSQK